MHKIEEINNTIENILDIQQEFQVLINRLLQDVADYVESAGTI